MTLLELTRIPFPVCKTGVAQVFLLKHRDLSSAATLEKMDVMEC